jgi:hypothetical protein
MKSKKRDTSIARNIWKLTFGEIPKDELGRSYEILLLKNLAIY